jgi:hypothetical protein
MQNAQIFKSYRTTSVGSVRERRFTTSVLWAAVAWIASTAAARGPIEVTELSRQTDAGPVRGFVAVIDLKAPELEILGPAPLDSGAKQNPAAEARLEPTDQWAARVGAELAINTNYFGKLAPTKDASGAAHGYASGQEADIIGLCIVDGVVISPPRAVDGIGDPGLIIRDDGTAMAGRITQEQLSQARFGVAGVGKSDTGQDALPGTLLVEHGRSLGAGARVDAAKRHPRTAIGVRDDARHLVIVVIDGRAPAYSVGVTLPELAEIMIEQGVTDAVNLDGGGSSAFVYAAREDAGKDHSAGADGSASVRSMANRPSDGRFRPVAASLGFRTRSTSGRDGSGGSDARGSSGR